MGKELPLFTYLVLMEQRSLYNPTPGYFLSFFENLFDIINYMRGNAALIVSINNGHLYFETLFYNLFVFVVMAWYLFNFFYNSCAFKNAISIQLKILLHQRLI